MRRRALVVLLAGGALVAASIWTVCGLGYWLVVSDPLVPARAVVVLGGDFPFRAVEAASMYRQGWAAEVWLQRTESPAREAALARLGFQAVREDLWNRGALERFGVPPEAIRLLDSRARNTAEEIQAAATELRRVGGERVIVVTSKVHSRRVASIWKSLVGDHPQVVVRYAAQDPFDPVRWWNRTEDALAVAREVFGLLNVWTGFPVRPDSAPTLSR